MSLETLPIPIIFGHRGAKAFAPENTLAAFQMAVEHRADAIEFDVKLTKDHHVIVLHDQTLDRTTNGHGNMKNYSLEDLRRLDAGSFFDAQFAGEKIPTLDEVFETVGRRLFMNIELTNYTTPHDGLVEQVVEVIRRHQQEDNVLFSSFLTLNILTARRLLPEVPVGLLAEEGWSGFVARSAFGRRIAPKIIHPYTTDVTDDYVRIQHNLGRRVHVWTVNEPEDMVRLFALKVDGIFTDNPRLARQVLEEQPKAGV
jgi:glycerophosphoryl diester phosphodiesterase